MVCIPEQFWHSPATARYRRGYRLGRVVHLLRLLETAGERETLTLSLPCWAHGDNLRRAVSKLDAYFAEMAADGLADWHAADGRGRLTLLAPLLPACAETDADEGEGDSFFEARREAARLRKAAERARRLENVTADVTPKSVTSHTDVTPLTYTRASESNPDQIRSDSIFINKSDQIRSDQSDATPKRVADSLSAVKRVADSLSAVSPDAPPPLVPTTENLPPHLLPLVDGVRQDAEQWTPDELDAGLKRLMHQQSRGKITKPLGYLRKTLASVRAEQSQQQAIAQQQAFTLLSVARATPAPTSRNGKERMCHSFRPTSSDAPCSSLRDNAEHPPLNAAPNHEPFSVPMPPALKTAMTSIGLGPRRFAGVVPLDAEGEQRRRDDLRRQAEALERAG